MTRKPKIQLGQGLVEFALILPFLLLVVLGTFDMGRAVYTKTVISNAAREGARVGIIPGKSDAEIRTAAINMAVGVPLQTSHITISRNAASETITVNIAFPLTPMTPLIGQYFGPSGTLTVRSSATMKTE